MEKTTKDKIEQDLKNSIGRDLKPNEIMNLENDALLLAKFLIKKVEELEKRIKKLE